MAVSKRAKSLYTGFFDGIETFAANTIQIVLEERCLNRYLDKEAKLTYEQEKQIKEFWAPYCKISPKWALYYSSKNGKFDPRYIPNTLYYTRIDQHFNARKLGYGFNDKNYYSRLFPNVKKIFLFNFNINNNNNTTKLSPSIFSKRYPKKPIRYGKRFFHINNHKYNYRNSSKKHNSPNINRYTLFYASWRFFNKQKIFQR